MKFRSIIFAVIAGLASIVVHADEVKQGITVTSQAKQDADKLDARLADAMKVTQDRIANLSQTEKEKLLDDLHHPDGKTIGQGMAAFGKELGQGLGSAVREAGSTFNEFANSGVGKITAAIIVWKLFGRAFLWFVFILLLLKGVGKFLTRMFGKYDEKGKLVNFDLSVLNKTDDSVIFGIFVVITGILLACVVGAAVNF